MKRNLVDEIIDIKSRTELDSRFLYTSRLINIEHTFKESHRINPDLEREFIKYLPISTIACFETFFRSVYKEIIDFGDPYSSNAIKFNQSKNVKFDFDIVNAIQSKKVSIGDFISHILPCNNFNDISFNLSTLINKDFVKEIKKYNENSNLFINDSDQTIADIIRVFELRHIFCHEFSTNFKIDKEEIFRCLRSGSVFLRQTNNYISELLYPDSLNSQAEMSIAAIKQYELIENELKDLIKKIKTILKDEIDMKLFNKAIKDWEKYRDSKAKLDSSFSIGGSINSLIFSTSLTTITKEKIESLTNDYQYVLDYHFKA